MIVELALAVVSGAGVGWITNSIAVSMLFKKYGKWGGVIEEHYEEFIKNMSQLVEDDLVNSKTLQGELNAPPFQKVLCAWIEDLLRKKLPEKSGSVRFEELPGIEQSAAQMISLIRELDTALIDSIYKVFENRFIQDILSKEQVIDTSVQASKNYQQDILHTVLSGRVISTLLSQNAVGCIIENIGDAIEKIDFSQFDGDLNHAYNALQKEIDTVIAELEQSLGPMRFAGFIKDSDHFSQELISRFIHFSQTAQGQTLLLEVIKTMLQDAKNIHLKIEDMVSPDVKAGIAAFIHEKLPGIIDRIAGFIDDTGEEIEAIVNDTIDRHLETSTQGVFLKLGKDLFIKDAAKQFNVVDTIISAVRKRRDTAGNGAVKELSAFIENKTIGDLTGILQDQNILTPQKLAAVINLNLQDLPRKNYNMIEKLLYAKVNDYFKPDLSKIKTVLLPDLFNKIKQDYLYQKAFKKDLQSGIKIQITELVQKPLEDFSILRNLSLKEQTIRNALSALWDKVSAKKISAVIPRNKVRELKINWESLWKRHKHRNLNQVYRGIQTETVYTKVAEGIMEILNQHLDRIITGNVSNLVDQELKKSSPSQVRAMVQDFMGKELKPINLFGAFLGAIAGGLSVGAASLCGVPREFIWWMLLVYGAVFSIVGIGTNWLAIKMLFRPYKKILFNVSPFIGIAALRKPQFAKNISQFVQEKTLNEAVLTQFFTDHKDSLQEAAGLWISDFDDLVKNEQVLERITNGVFSALQNYVTRHRHRHNVGVGVGAAALLKDLIASGKLDKYLRDGIMPAVQKSDPASALYKLLAKELEGKTIGHYRNEILHFVDLQSNSISEMLMNFLTLENIKQFLYRQEDRFSAYIESHSLEDLAGPQITADIVRGISEKAEKMIHTAVVNYFKDKELNPNTKLKDVFNGKIAGLLEKHLDYFLDLISQEISAEKGALVEQITDSMPWYAAPAKGQIAPIVDLLIDQELPKFLAQKRGHILAIVNTLLEYPLSQLGFSPETLNTSTVEQAISAVLDSPHVRQSVTHFVRVVAEQYTRIPLRSILALLNITTIRDLAAVAEPLLETAVSSVKARLLHTGFMAGFIKYFIGAVIDRVTDLLKGIDLEKELRNFMTMVLSDETTTASVSCILTAILKDAAKNYRQEILQKDLEDFLAGIQEQEWEQLRRDCMPLFKLFFQRLNGAVSAETKQRICSAYLIPGALDAAECHFKDLIRSIDIQQVVEREINNMDPREIESLFNRFAGTYFTKIILYGWIGIFGGLLSYIIGVLLGQLY